MKRLTLPCMLAIAGMAVAQLCAGCSTGNFIVSEWRNPAYAAPAFNSVMVGGLSDQTSMRRNFEDEFLAQLKADGIDVFPSYRYIPENEKIDEASFKQAARKAGADALLIARSVKVEKKTEIEPSYFPVPSFGIFGRHVGGVWQGPFGGPSVTRYTEYTSEATLYDLKKDDIVWSATLRTSEQENVNTAVKLYVEAVVDALKEKKLLGIKK